MKREMSHEDIAYWLRHGQPVVQTRPAGLNLREMPLTHCGVELLVQFEYEPAEPAEDNYPGYPANCDVLTVKTKSGDDITELLDWQQITALEEKVLEALE